MKTTKCTAHYPSLLVSFSFLAFLIISSCSPHIDPVNFTPVARFSITPDSGNTTTIFHFEADSSFRMGMEENPVFARWDWEADGVWDKMFTSGDGMTHRFFAKGTYRIRMEVSTLMGKRDTIEALLNIPQGYSPPRAKFIVDPDSANIFTTFRFDASGSKDDEDSLDQLQFRWDFDGDNIWDTEFTSNPVVEHRFSNNKILNSRLEVRDPQEMTSTIQRRMVVTRLNDRIIPQLEYECWPCTIEDTFRFDASSSYVIDNPDAQLYYSWNLFTDGKWEVNHSNDPHFNTRIPFEGIHKVRLRVFDTDSLYMDYEQEVEVFPWNTEPVAVITLGNRYGNPSTDFYLHARWSTDRESGYFERHIEWDLNNDGKWDPEFDNLYEVWTTFSIPGYYPVSLKVTDTQGKWSIARDTILVVDGHRETGILEDKRGGYISTYYPIVKVGNTWWMQQNLRFNPPVNMPPWVAEAYLGQQDSVYKNGLLYPYNALYDSRFHACPNGWRLPTVEDWEQLMTDLGPDATLEKLLPGGVSEMHLPMSGSRSGRTSRYDKGRGEFVNFWTSSNTASGQTWVWYIDIKRRVNKPVVVGRQYWLAVRCLKE